MHSDPTGTRTTKLFMASSFIQRKVEGFVWIKKTPDKSRKLAFRPRSCLVCYNTSVFRPRASMLRALPGIFPGAIEIGFPLEYPILLQKWKTNISRSSFTPTVNHRVCSEHFLKDDYVRGIHPRDDTEASKHQLNKNAVPTVYPSYPVLKQKEMPKWRKPPKKRPLSTPSTTQASLPKETKPDMPLPDHSYCTSPDAVA
uniref:THAP domain-containing protein 1-like n=1 Tax=Myxine glutinosa TaxID=7769 RepID=UPI00358F71EF